MESDNLKVENDIAPFSHIKNQTAGVIRHMIQSGQYADDRKNNAAKYNSYQDYVEAQAGREDNSITNELTEALRATQSKYRTLLFKTSEI